MSLRLSQKPVPPTLSPCPAPAGPSSRDQRPGTLKVPRRGCDETKMSLDFPPTSSPFTPAATQSRGLFYYKVYIDRTTHALNIAPSYIFKHPLVRHASQQARRCSCQKVKGQKVWLSELSSPERALEPVSRSGLSTAMVQCGPQ